MPDATMPKKILIVKLGAIGDVCLVLPAAWRLHQAGVQIHWLCGKTVAPLLACYSWIHPIVADESLLLRTRSLGTFRELLRLWRVLLGTSFDLCALLQFDPRYRVLTLFTQTRKTILLDRTNRSFNLVSERHHTAEYARILSAATSDTESVEFTRENFAPVTPDRLPENPLPRSGQTRIALVPGGARNLMNDNPQRRWPIASYRALAEHLIERGYQVVLTGGPDDRWAAEYFVDLPVEDCIGAWKLPQTIAFYQSCDCVVSHDSGPLHFAGLTDCGIVAIFGPTAPAKFLPRRPRVTALWGGARLACRPCYDGKTFAPCSSIACMASVSPGSVLDAVNRILQSPAEPWRIEEIDQVDIMNGSMAS